MLLFVLIFCFLFVQSKLDFEDNILKNKRTQMIQKINDLISSHNVMVMNMIKPTGIFQVLLSILPKN
jgi:hypothetical protein